MKENCVYKNTQSSYINKLDQAECLGFVSSSLDDLFSISAL